MDNPGDDHAGETSAVKSKIKPDKGHQIKRSPHTKHAAIIHIAISVVLVLVAQGGQTPTKTTAQGTKQSSCGKHGLWVLH